MNVETRPPSVEDHRLAFIEVSFLLSIFATTVHDMMGGATAPVGRVAGRQAAAKLPVHLPEPTPAAVLEVVRAQLKPAFAIEGRAQGRVIELTVDRCAIRDVCRAECKEAGGDLCQLFHFYLDGLFNGLLQRPAKSTVVAGAERCQARIETR